MVDVAKINDQLDRFFKCTGRITVDAVTGRVSCTGSVKWQESAPRLSHLPVHFDRVRNDFDVGHGLLTTLEGCPTWVGGTFSCFFNKLTSLEHAPQHVGASFSCGHNQLTSLQHCPSYVGGSFECYQNYLTSLEHMPDVVHDELLCMNNKLTTLQGAPRVVMGELRCWGNKFESLEGCPQEIHGRIWMDKPNSDLPMLRVLTIQGVSDVMLGISTNVLQDIINKYLGMGKAGILACAAELIRAGFKGNAKL